jgi:hypothetical protein
MNNNDEDTELPDETSQDDDAAGAGSGPEGDDPVVTEAGALPYEFHDGTEDLLSHRVFPEGDVFYRRRVLARIASRPSRTSPSTVGSAGSDDDPL